MNLSFAVVFVFLCFAYSLACFAINIGKSKSALIGALLPAALFLTFAADYFMVIKADNLTGLKFFCAVQALYCIKLISETQGKPASRAVSAPAAALTVSIFLSELFWIGLIYACLFAMNLLLAFSAYRRTGRKLFFIGLALFAVCDIHVFLFNYAGSAAVRHYAEIALWFFYLPSQAVLSISGNSKLIVKESER